MHSPSSLSQPNHAEKDALILLMQEQIRALQEGFKHLESRLKMNSRNFSKPPSSDGVNKPAPKSLRVAGQQPTGGQKGHAGNTLRQASEPDTIGVHGVPDQCQACQRKLPFAHVSETRQVFDLPVLQFDVTEHHTMKAVCRCGHVHTGAFPAGVIADVQYGPRAQAAMVHLNQNHAVSVQRTAAQMNDFLGLPVSQATVIKASVASATILQPAVEAIGQAAVNADVLHADETGLRVARKLHWLHVLATDTLSSMGCHMIELLTHACRQSNLHCAEGQSPSSNSRKYQCEVRDLRDLYEAILRQAQTENPALPSTGKRGRPKQSKATNLIGRLRDYRDDVWRFMTQPDVPFTNNLAEQTVRMPKVKQKVSGCFRTLPGAQTYCVIRSYCATMHKQGANVFEALVAAFKGATPKPNFG